MGRRNQVRSRRLPAGLTQRFKLPNTEKPSLEEPMPMADGCRSSWKICHDHAKGCRLLETFARIQWYMQH